MKSRFHCQTFGVPYGDCLATPSWSTHRIVFIPFALLLVSTISLAQPVPARPAPIAGPVHGQEVSIPGKVSDVSGKPVPDATVIVGAFRATSNSNGEFKLVLPDAGPYTISAEANGFKPAVAEGISLASGEQLPIVMQRKADESTDATIVYDVPAREIKCWFDGLPPGPIGLDPCKSQRGHDWQKGQPYFYHGQAIHLIYTRAMFTDKIVANPTSTPTPEPPIPVYGSGATLPSLSGLIPVPTTVTGAGVTQPGGPQFAGVPLVSRTEPGPPFDLFSLIDRLDNKSFSTFLNNRFIGPASYANLQPLVAPDLGAHLRELSLLEPLSTVAATIQKDLDALLPIDAIGGFDDLIDKLRNFNLILNRESDLQQQFNSSGAGPHAQVVLTDDLLSKDPELKVLRDIVDYVTINITITASLTTDQLKNAAASWKVSWQDNEISCTPVFISKDAPPNSLRCRMLPSDIASRGSVKIVVTNDRLGAFKAEGTVDLKTRTVATKKDQNGAEITERNGSPVPDVTTDAAGNPLVAVGLTFPKITMTDLDNFRRAFKDAFSPRSWIDQLDLLKASETIITVGPKDQPASSNKYTLTTAVAKPTINSLTVIDDSSTQTPAFVNILIEGSGFSASATVQSNGSAVASLVMSDTEMRASISVPGGKPLGSNGPPLQLPITVVVGTATSVPVNLSLGNWGQPTISFVDSEPGAKANTINLTVSGTGLKQVTAVKLGDVTVPVPKPPKSDYTLRIPAPTPNDPVDVAVIAGSLTSNAVRLPVSERAADSRLIESARLLPQADGSYQLVVKGKNFADEDSVRWNAQPLSMAMNGTTTELTAIISADQSLSSGGVYVFKTPHGAAGLAFLQALNNAAQAANSDSLANLKANLNTIADHWEDIGVAETRTIAFNEAYRSLKDYESSSVNVMRFQDELNALTQDTVAKALVIVSSAQNTPLPDTYRQATIGRWTANTQVQLTLTREVRMVLPSLTSIATNGGVTVYTAPGSAPTSTSFALAVVTPAPQATPSSAQAALTIKTETTANGTTTTTTLPGNAASAPPSANAIAQAPAQSPTSPGASNNASPAGQPVASNTSPTPPAAGGANSPSTQGTAPSANAAPAAPGGAAQPDDSENFFVHERYHFRLGAGFVYAFSPDPRYEVFTQTPTGAGGASGTTTSGASGLQAQQFIAQTRDRHYNLLLTADLMIYPWHQDMNEWTPRFQGDRRPAWWKGFSGLIGFSVTSPSTDFIIGGAYFPFRNNRAIGLKFGEHLGLRDEPPAGIALNTPLTQPVVVLRQQLVRGVFVGLVFDQQFFTTVFGSIFK
jgi:hypothetical protein